MAAISKNKYDVFMWIKKVILSCETLKQLFVAFDLVSNFEKMYKDDFLVFRLDDTLVSKRQELMSN